MTTYPLSTLAATIGPTGIYAPSFADILLSLQASYKNIYGPTAVLTNDSKDGQWLGIMASAINDSNNLAIATYNAFSPSTAQGAGLSSVVKINGLARQVASYSTAIMLLEGDPGTVIRSGQLTDSVNNIWDLPSSVKLSEESGAATVTAICETLGAIEAPAGTLVNIKNPQLGWASAVNMQDASLGAPVEVDWELRRRQSLSTKMRALSAKEGLYGALASIKNVTAVVIYENDTDFTDPVTGIPGNTIAIVVSGGSSDTIAKTIATYKTMGTGTLGSVKTVVFDSYNMPNVIYFYTPTVVHAYITITIKPKTSYSNTTDTIITNAVVDYINSLGIGAGDEGGAGVVYLSRIEAIASIMNSVLNRTFSISSIICGRSANAQTAVDLPITFHEKPYASTTTVQIVHAS